MLFSELSLLTKLNVEGQLYKNPKGVLLLSKNLFVGFTFTSFKQFY